ncbi:MAG: HEPN domain-containing protein [Rhodocyclaceae bacterium]|nr:MAG: HEPN domain-containing protein [Rhodocyclaceae bacterium]
MASGESRYPQDWFRIAAKDLQRVARRLAEKDVDDAAFRLQQAVEKGLKGFLLARGWRLKRVHDLELLLSDAVRHDRGLERYRLFCRQVASYYILERYPTLEESPSLAEVRDAYAQARTLVRKLRSRGSWGRRRA